MDSEHKDREPDESRILQRRIENERIKLFASCMNSLALGLIGFGFLRYVFDPSTIKPSHWVTGTAVSGAVVSEAFGLYILRYLRSES